MYQRIIEKVPWTIRQTFSGVFFTLLPWLLFIFALSRLNTGTPDTKPLTVQQDLASAIFGFIFALLGEGIFLIAPLIIARRTTPPVPTRWQSLREVLGFRRFPVWQTLSLILLFFVAILVVNSVYSILITTLHLHLQTNDQSVLQSGRRAPISMYATLLAAVIIAPICEEIFFRSMTFMGLRNGMPVGVAVVFSALIFGVAHGDEGSFAVLFCIGLALAFLRWRTQSIWPGIILHMLNNAASALSIILTLYGVLHI